MGGHLGVADPAAGGHQVDLAGAHDRPVAGAVAVLDLAGEQPADRLQTGVRVGGHDHAARLGDVVRAVVVEEAPGADHGAATARQRAPYVHRAQAAERHLARLDHAHGGHVTSLPRRPRPRSRAATRVGGTGASAPCRATRWLRARLRLRRRTVGPGRPAGAAVRASRARPGRPAPRARARERGRPGPAPGRRCRPRCRCRPGRPGSRAAPAPSPVGAADRETTSVGAGCSESSAPSHVSVVRLVVLDGREAQRARLLRHPPRDRELAERVRRQPAALPVHGDRRPVAAYVDGGAPARARTPRSRAGSPRGG